MSFTGALSQKRWSANCNLLFNKLSMVSLEDSNLLCNSRIVLSSHMVLQLIELGAISFNLVISFFDVVNSNNDATPENNKKTTLAQLIQSQNCISH